MLQELKLKGKTTYDIFATNSVIVHANGGKRDDKSTSTGACDVWQVAQGPGIILYGNQHRSYPLETCTSR